TSASDTTSTTFTTLGLRASHELTLNDRPITFTGMIGWRHAFGDVDPNANVSFTNGGDFAVLATPIAEDAAAVELGFDMDISDKATLGISYNGQFGDGAQDHGVNAALRFQF
ncbi:autotransporter outer membrane beta-barrel domain-containing protein, partial [Aureimonas fodinaquatilis]